MPRIRDFSAAGPGTVSAPAQNLTRKVCVSRSEHDGDCGATALLHAGARDAALLAPHQRNFLVSVDQPFHQPCLGALDCSAAVEGALEGPTFKNSFFIIFDSKEEACVFACSFLAILIQHGVGGALCMPSTLGAVGRGAWALACHGALCEAGWELQDLATRITQVICGHVDAGPMTDPGQCNVTSVVLCDS